MAEPTGPGPVLVVIPTYDERDNLRPVLARVHRAVPDADVLVVDDASPDGTGDLAEEIAADDPHLHVLHRTGKAGLGAAYLAGFEWAMQRDYRVVVQMDADGSHPPEALPAMLAALADADLVVGSRYVPGGEVRNWPAHRQWLSRGGNLYSRLALGIPTRDVTAGYRAFRRQVLTELDLGSVVSQGYCFQIDMTWRALQGGFRVVEVPITFTERERGTSKMSGAIVAEALWHVARWGARRLLRRPGPGARPAPTPAVSTTVSTTTSATAGATTTGAPVEDGADAPALDAPAPTAAGPAAGPDQSATVVDDAAAALADGQVRDGSVRA